MEEIVLGKTVNVRHTNERNQGFSYVFFKLFYSIHLSVVSQSCSVWERREGDKVYYGEGLYLVGSAWRSRGNYRLSINVCMNLNCYFP